MFAMTDPAKARQPFFDAWKKFHQHQPLTDLEKQLVQVILDHPEYHAIFHDPVHFLDKVYSSDQESNPHMHLSIHLVLRDQISLDNPQGIRPIYQQLCEHYGNPLEAEHAMIECLIQELWPVMNGGQPFNNERYLQQLRQAVL